jgi:hypothetical protein
LRTKNVDCEDASKLSTRDYEDSSSISLFFTKHSMFVLHQEPCTASIPYKQGALKSADDVGVFDGDEPLTSQARALSLWEDGSVKWLMVSFLTDLPGWEGKSFAGHRKFLLNSPVVKELSVKAATGRGRTAAEQPAPRDRAIVSIGEVDGRTRIDNGLLTITLANAVDSNQRGIFEEIRFRDATCSNGQISAPIVQTEDGSLFEASVSDEYGPTGWDVIENGPARAVLRTYGKHTSPEGQWLDHMTYLTVYAGKSWLDLDYRMINKEDADIDIKSIEMTFTPTPNDTSEVTLRGNTLRTSYGFSTVVRNSTGETVETIIDQERVLAFGNQGSQFIGFGNAYGAWTDNERGGISATVYQPLQNYPKAFIASASGLTVCIKPGDAPCLSIPAGSALMQSVKLTFHDKEGSTEEAKLERDAEIKIRSALYSTPERPQIHPLVYENSGVIQGGTYHCPGNGDVENVIYKLFRSTGNAMGMANWPDYFANSFTEVDGKQEVRWNNLMYDFMDASFLAYLTSMNREYYEAFLAAGRHSLNMDITHYTADPDAIHNGAMHCGEHRHASGKGDTAWMWVDGLLDYYHETGDPFALKAAIGCGRNTERKLDARNWSGFSPRQISNPLRVFTTLYFETYDDRWKLLAEKVVDTICRNVARKGTLPVLSVDLAPVARKSFMVGGVACFALYRHYLMFQADRTKQILMNIAEDVINTDLHHTGAFMYVDSVKGAYSNVMPCIALIAMYKLTGDKAWLRKGLTGYFTLVRNKAYAHVTSERVVFDNGHVHAAGAYSFAHDYYGFASFYKEAYEAGLVESDLDDVWHLTD